MLRTRVVPRLVCLAALLASSTATAQPADLPSPMPPQVQLDLGLSVITLNYEHPLPANLALAVGVGVFSTWFAPVFDVGDKFIGPGAELRLTRFFTDDGRGLYAGPFVRVSRAKGEREVEDTTLEGTTFGFTVGAVAGYGIGLTERLDLRLGLGAQYMRFVTDDVEVNTPFVVLDAVLGYRL
jgi:hypothetical protein